MALKWTHTRKKVILEDGKTATRDTYFAKGKKNEYLFIINYHKGGINTYRDSLFVNGKLKWNFLSAGLPIMENTANQIEKRQIASAKKKIDPKKTTPAKQTATKTTAKRKENLFILNGKKFYMDENKVKMKNGKKFFYLFKTYKKQNHGRMNKWWIYVPVKKKGREQWEVYHIDKNDPTYGVFGYKKSKR